MKDRLITIALSVATTPGAPYVIFQPNPGEAFSVELKAGAYRYRWLTADKAEVAGEGRMESPGGKQEFKPPFAGKAVLELKADKRG
jgi:hypothetical protein